MIEGQWKSVVISGVSYTLKVSGFQSSFFISHTINVCVQRNSVLAIRLFWPASDYVPVNVHITSSGLVTASILIQFNGILITASSVLGFL